MFSTYIVSSNRCASPQSRRKTALWFTVGENLTLWNVPKIRMFPCSQSNHVKEALFGVYHYDGVLGEFHNQKGKKNHSWLQESIKLFSTLNRLHEGDIFSFLPFYWTILRIKWAYGQIISTPINGPFRAYWVMMRTQKISIKAKDFVRISKLLRGTTARQTWKKTQHIIVPLSGLQVRRLFSQGSILDVILYDIYEVLTDLQNKLIFFLQ